MARSIATTGTAAAAEAMRQIEPDVVAAYPITPQTNIVEEFASFVANGKVRTEFVNVESEHSALSACVGAAAAGARAMTASSSQGIALMWEIMHIASGLRLPIIMPCSNRALSAPINIHCDHSDAMGCRDTGWIQLFCEDAQETYDNTIMAVKIGEDDRVKLPVMVNMDGFIISHSIARMDVLEDKEVKTFVGERKITFNMFDQENPVTVGSFDGLGGWYQEFKHQQDDAMISAKQVISEVSESFARLSGRNYGFFESYRMDDAETAVLVMGSTAGTVRAVVDVLREQGQKVGMIKLRMYRPFPREELAIALQDVKAVGIMDRATTLSGWHAGPVFYEVQSALYPLQKRPAVVPYIYGLGGRDIRPDHIAGVFEELNSFERGEIPIWKARYVNQKGSVDEAVPIKARQS